MEKEQYNLFRKDYTEIPNIYFDLQKKYTAASDTPTIDMNPNKISQQCSSIPNNPLSGNGNTNDKNYDFYVNKNGGFNNFVYNYATGEESMDFNEPVKNQLKYLGCQIFKNKNKKFDTNNYSSSKFTFDRVASGIAMAVVVWCLFSYFMHVFKGGTNNFFEKFNITNTSKLLLKERIGSLIILILITGGILAWITLSSNMTIPTVNDPSNNVIDDNIVFYNNNNSNDADVQKSVNISKWGFFSFLLLMFSIYYVSQYLGIHSGVVYVICTICFIIGIILLFCYNNIQDQSIHVEDNDYNTGKNIYQSILDGIKQNFKYIIALLSISLISYIALIAFNTKIKGINNWGILIPIVLLSSFAYFLPIMILLFELCFAFVNPLGFGISIIVMRFVLYIISYILGTFVSGKSFTPKLLSVLFEYPESYMDKLVSPSTKPNIASTNYPKNNPSGMPWNTLSMNISKIAVGIMSMPKGKLKVQNLNQTYFGRMLN
jgi:hypothetical protein